MEPIIDVLGDLMSFLDHKRFCEQVLYEPSTRQNCTCGLYEIRAKVMAQATMVPPDADPYLHTTLYGVKVKVLLDD